MFILDVQIINGWEKNEKKFINIKFYNTITCLKYKIVIELNYILSMIMSRLTTNYLRDGHDIHYFNMCVHTQN